MKSRRAALDPLKGQRHPHHHRSKVAKRKRGIEIAIKIGFGIKFNNRDSTENVEENRCIE